jgi:hypothetical protein
MHSSFVPEFSEPVLCFHRHSRFVPSILKLLRAFLRCRERHDALNQQTGQCSCRLQCPSKKWAPASAGQTKAVARSRFAIPCPCLLLSAPEG